MSAFFSSEWVPPAVKHMMNSEIYQCEPSHLWFSTGPDSFGDNAQGGAYAPSTGVGNLRVLIVKDEFFIALDAQAQVEGLGHTVVGIAVSADEAIAMVERSTPDIVLMDIRLQGSRDGIDAAKEIRTRFGSRIVFVTANTDPGTRARADAVKPTAFLEKPLTSLRLKHALTI